MKAFKTIKANGVTEEEIKKSRFICHLQRVKTEEEARDFITNVKKEHHKANHNCSCFIVGENADMKRSSDDGEPSGTAGIPMLTVLENNELTNVVAVVTRYFGGVKLGTGGLIRAYTESVAKAIREVGQVLVKQQAGIAVTLSYTQYQDFANWRRKHHLEEYDPQFLTEVEVTVYSDEDKVNELLADLEDFYRGQVAIRTSGSRMVELDLH